MAMVWFRNTPRFMGLSKLMSFKSKKLNVTTYKCQSNSLEELAEQAKPDLLREQFFNLHGF